MAFVLDRGVFLRVVSNYALRPFKGFIFRCALINWCESNEYSVLDSCNDCFVCDVMNDVRL